MRADGYDVWAAADVPELADVSDEEFLRQASAGGRAVVTENVKDFDRIVRSWVATGDDHAGGSSRRPGGFTVEAPVIPKI